MLWLSRFRDKQIYCGWSRVQARSQISCSMSHSFWVIFLCYLPYQYSSSITPICHIMPIALLANILSHFRQSPSSIVIVLHRSKRFEEHITPYKPTLRCLFFVVFQRNLENWSLSGILFCLINRMKKLLFSKTSVLQHPIITWFAHEGTSEMQKTWKQSINHFVS